MNRIVFDLQTFANINNSKSNTLVSGTADNDTINSYGSNVTIDAGAGNDSIYGSDSNVTITSGAGNDSIDVSGTGTTITDFDVSDKLLLANNVPLTYAKFVNNTLIFGDDNSSVVKINLPNVTNIKNYRDMVVYCRDLSTYSYEFETTLGELLDAPAPYWTISGTTAKYYDSNGKLQATLTGLKSGLKVVNGEISGIDIGIDEYYGGKHITLSKSVLGTGKVTLSTSADYSSYDLALADDVAQASFETNPNDTLICTWSLSGTTATCTTKSLSGGYYVANNRTVGYVGDNSTVTIGKIVGIKSGTKLNSDGSITGIITPSGGWNGMIGGSFFIGDASVLERV